MNLLYNNFLKIKGEKAWKFSIESIINRFELNANVPDMAQIIASVSSFHLNHKTRAPVRKRMLQTYSGSKLQGGGERRLSRRITGWPTAATRESARAEV